MSEGPATFYEYLRKKGLVESTCRKYRDIAARWEGSTPEKYLSQCRDDQMPMGTAMPILSAARHWTRWHGYELDDTLTWTRREGFHGLVLTKAEAQAVLDTLQPLIANEMERASFRAATVALETGLRGSSIEHLKAEHAVDEQYVVLGKRSKVLSAPMNKKACAVVEDQCADGGAFPPKHQLRRHWRYLRNKHPNAKYHKVTLHTFRHTFGSGVASLEGVSLQDLKELMGHSSIQTTEKYLHTNTKRIARAIEAWGEKEQDE